MKTIFNFAVVAVLALGSNAMAQHSTTTTRSTTTTSKKVEIGYGNKPNRGNKYGHSSNHSNHGHNTHNNCTQLNCGHTDHNHNNNGHNNGNYGHGNMNNGHNNGNHNHGNMNNGHNNGNYGHGNMNNGHFNNQANHVDNASFNRFMQTLKDESFDSGKLKTANFYAKNSSLTTDQIAQIIDQFSFDSSKVEFAKNAYATCCDKNNYPTLKRNFSFSSSFNDVMKYIGY